MTKGSILFHTIMTAITGGLWLLVMIVLWVVKNK